MSKRYADSIEVESSGGAPRAFRWRGAHYRVRMVSRRWREAGGWWEVPDGTDKPWAGARAREVVRVTAARSGGADGMYELARDMRTGAWSMLRVWD